MILLIIAFLGTFGLVLSAGMLVFYRDDIRERLSVIVEQRLGPSKNSLLSLFQPRKGAMEQIVRPFENVLPRSTQEASAVQKRLIRAGFRKDAAVNLFFGTKVLAPICMAIFVTLTGVYTWEPFLVYTIAAGLGFLVPDFWLSYRTSSRQLRIRLGLPEALDLMVICSEAGLSLDQDILKVSQELRLSQPDLADEFGLLMLEQRAGRPRDEALQALADRTGVDAVRSLVHTLIQANKFGTSIAKTLRVYSETLRITRRQQAEERAAKTTVKLVFPLVLFIFPSFFVVALGPAMIAMYQGFSQYFGG